MNRRQPLVIGLIWLATVAGASTLTWGVISSTGAKVGQPEPLSAATASLPSATGTTTTTAAKSATWSEAPGKVIASCKGSAVSLVSAIPNDGYKVQTEREGAKVLEVEFEKTGPGEHEEGEVHLKISCTDGAPVFRRD